jgi:pyruvate dehydrogenase E2 component (dihydrolipoamide acetyltransferase)
MAEFRMPSLGSGMEQGTLVEWLKKPGERITPGDIIAVIETEKGAIEVEAFQGGTFMRSLIEIGATVPVGTPIAIIDGASETATPAAPRPPEAPRPIPLPAAPLATPWRDIGLAVKVSPAARRLAEERGIDLTTLKGSGPEGGIVYIDIENATLSARPKHAVAPAKKAKPGFDTAAMRTIIAAATARSKREIPHYYLMHDVDVTGMAAWLAERNAPRTPDQRILPAAVYLKALAAAIRKHPGFNGFYGENGFQESEGVHIGVAITVRGGGLVAPAIHDTDKLSLDELMQHLRDLVERVRAGRFRSSELSDSTITLTNLGDRGVDGVIPVIYPPQVAIGGVGTPRERPWVVDGKLEARQVVTLSLAGDHRASNGHQGALFLATWAELVQGPEQL